MAADLDNNPQPDESLENFDDSMMDSSGDTELEQYGVWVKVAPEDVAAESTAGDDFDLEDLSVEQMDESALLTEEEEQLLGNLTAPLAGEVTHAAGKDAAAIQPPLAGLSIDPDLANPKALLRPIQILRAVPQGQPDLIDPGRPVEEEPPRRRARPAAERGRGVCPVAGRGLTVGVGSCERHHLAAGDRPEGHLHRHPSARPQRRGVARVDVQGTDGVLQKDRPNPPGRHRPSR